MKRISIGAAPKRLALMGLAVFTLLLAMISPAAAQGFSPGDAAALFGTQHGDGFTSIFLNQLFGPLFPAINETPTATVFSSIIGYFNIIILIIGGGMFFWNISVGIMQSAHEGAVLGQRWSSLWAPLRVIFAIGLLVPVPGLNGYNLVQAGVAYIVKGSTNIASLIWTESATMVISGTTPIAASPPTIPDTVFKTLYQNAACTAILGDQLRVAAAAAGTSPLRIQLTGPSSASQTSVQTVLARDNGGAVHHSNYNICGGFSTPSLPAYIENLQDQPGVTLGIQPSQKESISREFTEAHFAAMNGIYMDMVALTRSHLSIMKDPGAPLPDMSAEIAAAQTRSNAVLNTRISNILTMAVGADRTGQAARNALLARIRGNCVQGSASTADGSPTMNCYGEGWIGAGSWYMMMAQLNNQIASLTDAVGRASNGSYIRNIESDNRQLYIASGGETGFLGGVGSRARDAGMASNEEATLIMARYDEAFRNSTAGLAALGFPMSADDLRDLNEAVTSDGILEKIPGLKGNFTEFVNNVTSIGSPSRYGSDPMVGLTVIGKGLIEIAGVMMAVAGIGGFISGGALATVLLPIISVLLTAGSTLAYILPIMPFMFWILAVTGYFLLVVEAIVAVNLWALSHMRMDGEGISGEAGRNGWLMLLSLLMTPVLMVFGFLIGMTIFRITSNLIDLGFAQAMSGIIGGELFNALIAVCVYTVLMAVMYMVLIERSFSLVTEFPSKVLRWMGASAELTNGEENRARIAAGVAAGSVYRGATSAGRGVASTTSAAGFARDSGRRDADNKAIPGAARRWMQRRASASEG